MKFRLLRSILALGTGTQLENTAYGKAIRQNRNWKHTNEFIESNYEHLKLDNPGACSGSIVWAHNGSSLY